MNKILFPILLLFLTCETPVEPDIAPLFLPLQLKVLSDGIVKWGYMSRGAFVPNDDIKSNDLRIIFTGYDITNKSEPIKIWENDAGITEQSITWSWSVEYEPVQLSELLKGRVYRFYADSDTLLATEYSPNTVLPAVRVEVGGVDASVNIEIIEL